MGYEVGGCGWGIYGKWWVRWRKVWMRWGFIYGISSREVRGVIKVRSWF